MNTIVLKFGSSILENSQCIHLAANEISNRVRQGDKVVTVVSALAGETDRLFEMILDLDPKTADSHIADFVSTGERQSTILLTATLAGMDIRAVAVEARDIGLIATGAVLDSDPTDINVENIMSRLETCDVVVVPGFVAQNRRGQTVLLGRGGSDDTALFLANRIGARCRLIKDVNGIFEWDPAKPGPTPRRFLRISWEDALNVANELVQGKATRYAKKNSVSFEIAALGSAGGTVVGQGPTELENHTHREPELNNALTI